jgi:hypothetical protein
VRTANYAATYRHWVATHFFQGGIDMAMWQYILLLLFLFGIGYEINEVNANLGRILKQLEKQK